MPQNARNIAERLQSLGPEQIAEVENFIDFLRFRAHEHALTRASVAVSEPTFQAIWANPEDDVYDVL